MAYEKSNIGFQVQLGTRLSGIEYQQDWIHSISQNRSETFTTYLLGEDLKNTNLRLEFVIGFNDVVSRERVVYTQGSYAGELLTRFKSNSLKLLTLLLYEIVTE